MGFISHDFDARYDIKILRLRMKLGPAGYGIFWMIVERLGNDPKHESPRDYDVLAMDMGTDVATVKSVVEDFDLFKMTEDGNSFYSDSVNRRMAYRDESIKKHSEAGRKGAKKRWNKGDAKAVPTEPDSNANGYAIAPPLDKDSSAMASPSDTDSSAKGAPMVRHSSNDGTTWQTKLNETKRNDTKQNDTKRKKERAPKKSGSKPSLSNLSKTDKQLAHENDFLNRAGDYYRQWFSSKDFPWNIARQNRFLQLTRKYGEHATSQALETAVGRTDADPIQYISGILHNQEAEGNLPQGVEA